MIFPARRNLVAAVPAGFLICLRDCHPLAANRLFAPADYQADVQTALMTGRTAALLAADFDCRTADYLLTAADGRLLFYPDYSAKTIVAAVVFAALNLSLIHI